MIFGEIHSRFVYNGTDTVDLQHTVLDPSFIIPDMLEHESPITGKRHYLLKQDLSEFTNQINLYKYADPKAKYLELMAYKGQLVTYQPHADGNFIKNIYGDNILFYISNIEPYYLMQTKEYDLVNITFKAVEPVNYYASIPGLGYGYGYGLNYGVQL